MKKGKLFSSLLCALSLGVAGVAGLFGEKKIEEAKADSEPVTVISDFTYETNNGTYGYFENNFRYFAPGKSTNSNLQNVSLNFFSGQNVDENVKLTYNGNNSNWAPSNFVRSSYSGYMQIRFPSAVNDDGAGIVITPKDVRYRITSIAFTFHERNFNQKESGEAYYHIIKNGVSSYATIDDLEISTSSPTYTWSDKNGITSFEFNISLKHSDYTDKEKCSMVQSISVTYVERTDVSLVTFDSNGGSAVDSVYVVNGTKVDRPQNPTKPTVGETSYIFVNWYTTLEGETLFDFNSAINADVTAYAHWIETQADIYTMTFETNGGSAVSDIQTISGSPFVQPADPTRTPSDTNKYSFTFAGWYSDSTLKTAYDWSTLASSDTTLYAKWTFSTIDNIPSERVHYEIANDAVTWASTAHYTNDTYYQDVTLNSWNTFDSTHAKEQLNLHILSNDSSRGFWVHKVYSQCVRNAKVTITPVDESKIITYIRFDFIHWSTASVGMTLYKTGSSTNSDTSTCPDSSETTHYLQASFSESERVKSVEMNVGNALMLVNNFYIVYAEDPDFTTAKTFATNFLQAMQNDGVCGATQDRWEDNNYDAVSSVWSTWKSTFNGYGTEVKGFFNTSEDATIAQARQLYEHIVTRYGVDKWTDGPTVSSILLPNSIGQLNSETTISIVVIVTVVAITAVGLIFFIRRRKYN